jgi:hypothetical protein
VRRSGPLPRRTELKRTTELPRGVDLVRVTPLRQRAVPATPHAKLAASAERAAEKLAREIVGERSGGWCEIRIPGECLGRMSNWCHRIAEGQGGRWLASNGVGGCGSGTTGCHGWTHRNPALAEAHGWIVAPTYQVVDGLRVRLDADAFPAYLWRPGSSAPDWMWLDNHGGAVTVDQVDAV